MMAPPRLFWGLTRGEELREHWEKMEKRAEVEARLKGWAPTVNSG